MDLSGILTSTVDGRTKGMPPESGTLALADIGRQGWSIFSGDLPLPLAVIRKSVLGENSRWMRAFLEKTGARIAPHGKTTMAPQLFKLQLEDGAVAITVATTQQMRVCRDFGVGSILLANQLVGRAEIGYVVGELKRDPEFSFLCFVDSVGNVAELAAAAKAAGLKRPLRVLLELGFPGGRTGARTSADAIAVARAVAAEHPALELAGVAAFEGLIGRATPEETAAAVNEFLGFIADCASTADGEGLFKGKAPIILTAGGTAYFDLVVDRFTALKLSRATEVIIRSGCYLTHDGHMYRDLFTAIEKRHPDFAALGPGLRPALQVWARVQSRPEQGKAIVAVGKRDISYDVHLPQPAMWLRPGMAEPEPIPAGYTVTGLNDQHCHLTLPENSPLAVGDVIAFDVSHPCTTFDKWQLIHVIDDDHKVVDAIRTYF
ncbi:MAG: amino acid deaminase [Rhizobiales bacterium]|nr:amino acid deaminase [Hyphomicrobiales bacterium]